MTDRPPTDPARTPAAVSPRRRPRWRTLIALASGVVVLAVVAIGTLTAVSQSPQSALTPAPATAAGPSGSRTSGPASSAPPYIPVASVSSTFVGWTVDGQGDASTRFAAETGDAHDGAIGLAVSSSTAAGTPHASLGQLIPVAPSTTYEVGVWIRATGASESGIIVRTDDADRTDRTFEGSGGRWAHRAWTVRTAAGQTGMHLGILPDRPVDSIGLDGLTVTAAGTRAAVANGGFEQFTPGASGITNHSLVFTTGRTTLGVSMDRESVAWSIVDQKAQPVASGTTKLASHLGIIPLTSLPQGFYSVSLTEQGQQSPAISTTFMVLDPLPGGKPVVDQRLGVTVHPTIEQYRGSEPLVAELGFGQARMDAIWTTIEKTRGEYTFSAESDATYARLAEDGVSVLPIVDYRNKLYDGGRTPSSEAGIAAFAAFAAAVQAHYKQPAMEIYNEFNNPPMNDGLCGLTAACYLPLLDSTAAAVRAVSPTTQIVGPAVAHKDDPWLTDFYRLGGLKTVDAVSFHPYDSLGAPEFLDASLKQAQARIAQFSAGATPRPIWLTELGWTNAVASRPDQADYLVRAEALAFANGVTKFFWYDLVDHTPHPDVQGNFGLFSAPTELVPAFAPKQAAMTQAILARQLAGKRFIGREDIGTTAYSLQFGRGSGTARVLWATSPTTVQVRSTTPVIITNDYGVKTVLEPKKGFVQIALTGAPVYLAGDLPAPKVAAKH